MNKRVTATISKGTAREGDLVELASTQVKYFIFALKTGEEFHTHRGIVKHDDLIGKPYGSVIESHKGSRFYLLEPGITELIQTTKRNTQIMYPKDIGYILLRLNVKPGSRVIEAGTGSGAFTQVLASYVGPAGHVFSYDNREEMQNLAQKNIARYGFDERISFVVRDIADGFYEDNVDAVFLDLPNPFDFIQQVFNALKPGGFFGALLPTTNQVTKLLVALDRSNFVFIDVCELALRFYQSDASKFRPVDRMIAHTGYLIFARSIIHKNTGEE
jgi:tRNA (adenine57-N1/adenine58-N1)-methyltransferase